MIQGALCFSFQGIQMRFQFLTRNSLCINPCHSPSLLSNKRKHVGVLFLVGQQEARLGTKQSALNKHHQYRHHSCLRRTMRGGSWPCRSLGSHLGTNLARGTPRNHMRLVDQDGIRPMTRHGCITRPTLRGYHHLSIHDSPLQTIGSWTTSILALKD